MNDMGIIANHQFRDQTTSKVGCQPSDSHACFNLAITLEWYMKLTHLAVLKEAAHSHGLYT